MKRLPEILSKSVFREIPEVADESLRIRMQQWSGADVTLNLGSTASEFSIADMAPETGAAQVPSVTCMADENGVISTVGFGDGSGTFNTLSSIDFEKGEMTFQFSFDHYSAGGYARIYVTYKK